MFYKNVDIEEFEDEKPKDEKPLIKWDIFKSLLDGSLFTREFFLRQLPFIFYLTGLAIFYIGNRYHAEKVMREMIELQTEIKELRAESITTASELMYISKQSEVAKMVQERGLELVETLEPPKKIVIKEKEKIK